MIEKHYSHLKPRMRAYALAGAYRAEDGEKAAKKAPDEEKPAV